ncbi:MAG: host attachment protein [Mariprofundaceae bacterium]
MYRGKPIWVLAANAGEAGLYAANNPSSQLKEIERFDNPDGRAHERELTSDLPGRAFDSGGQGRHAMEQQVSPKEEAAIRFAATLAEHVAGRSDAFDKFYVAAAPAFLGLFRQALGNRLNGKAIVEIDKDYTALDARTLRARLPEYL